jgi:hypothetical protein
MNEEGKRSACVSRAVFGVPPNTSSPDTHRAGRHSNFKSGGTVSEMIVMGIRRKESLIAIPLTMFFRWIAIPSGPVKVSQSGSKRFSGSGWRSESVQVFNNEQLAE